MTPATENPSSVHFDPRQTALLVIDPVNDFLHEDGAAWAMTKSTVKKNDVVNQLARLTAGARKAGVPVLFGPMAYTAEDYTEQHLQRRSGINRLMYENEMFLAGSFGADFHADIQPQPGDIILAPHKGTDVLQTDLPEHLDRLGTTHLVLAGMTANLCVESTGRHATELGYDVTFLSDAIGAESLPAYEASIHVNYPLIGNAVLDRGRRVPRRRPASGLGARCRPRRRHRLRFRPRQDRRGRGDHPGARRRSRLRSRAARPARQGHLHPARRRHPPRRRSRLRQHPQARDRKDAVG